MTIGRQNQVSVGLPVRVSLAFILRNSFILLFFHNVILLLLEHATENVSFQRFTETLSSLSSCHVSSKTRGGQVLKSDNQRRRRAFSRRSHRLTFERDAEAKVDVLLGPIPRQTVVICKGNGTAPRATLKREGRTVTTWTSQASTGKPSAAHDSVRRERA